MMRVIAPSAATAPNATTTSGLGSGLSSGNQSKDSRSYLKLILCCFCLIVVVVIIVVSHYSRTKVAVLSSSSISHFSSRLPRDKNAING